MRKSFFFFITFILSVALLLGISLFAINSSTSEKKIQGYLEKTNSYSLIAGWIRDQLVKNSTIDLKHGQNLEILNETVNTEVATILVNDSLSEIFSAISLTKNEIIFNYSALIDQFEASTGLKLSLLPNEGSDHLFRFEVNNPIMFKLFSKFPLLELSMIAIALISIVTIFLLAHSNKERFLPIGIAFVLTALAALSITILIRTLGLEYILRQLELQDPKLIIIASRLLEAGSLEIQRVFIAGTVIFGAAGLVAVTIFRPAHKDKIELIGRAIDGK